MRFIDGWAVPEHCQTHAKWIAETGNLAHDTYIMDKLKPYIKEGMTVVDVGAHVGTHSIKYSNYVGFTGKVIAFEPNPEAFDCLKHNMGGIKNVRIHNLGLSNTDKKLGMVNNPQNIGANYLAGEGNIPCIRFDDLHLNNVDFIKVDIEGMEPEFLDGARNTIKNHKPVMFIEINRFALARNGYTPETVYDFLRKFGYTFKNITDGEELDGEQFDIICKPN